MNDPVPIDEQLDALLPQLDPTAQAVVGVMRVLVTDLREQLQRKREENAELKRMLFGQRSKRLPRIQDQVRRSIEAEELFGNDEVEGDKP